MSGATIEDRLGEPRGDAPYEARGIEQMSPVQPRDPDSTRKRYGRVELSRRDANLRACGMEPRLGRLNVRTLVHKFRGQADRQSAGQRQRGQIKVRR